MAGANVSTQRLVSARSSAAAPRGRRAAQNSRDPRDRGGRDDSADAMPLHARGVGQILDTALDVLVARFGPCVGIAAACWIPYQVANEVLNYSGLGQGAAFVSAGLSIMPEVLTSACVCSLVGAYLLRDRVSAWAAIRNGLIASLGIVVIALIQGIATVGLMCLCVLPMLLGYWLFAVGPTVYVLERRQLVEREVGRAPVLIAWVLGIAYSIRRGIRLVSGLASFGRWAGWSVVAGLAIVWPLIVMPTAFADATVREFLEDLFAVQGRPIELTIAAIGAVFVGIGTAYFAILKTVYYVDQRVRKEALDLELRLRRVVERRGLERG